jgi:photosystem II stability/assembly factor-like uncharacterized protein
MKRFIFTLMTLLILIANLRGQWEIINEGGAGGFNTIDFVDKNTGWLGGLQGEILKTEDGGETWVALPIDKDWSIAQLDFINKSVGWAVANYDNSDVEKGRILKTTNGGQSWSLQKKVGTSFLNSIYAVNDSVVYAAGDSIIFKTSDGGLSWIDVSPRNTKAIYQSICFLNNETGLVAGEYYDYTYGEGAWYIVSTADGGATWHRSTLRNVNSLHDLQFIDDSTGYFVCHNDNESLLYETKNIGKSWTLKLKSPFRISSLILANANTVYAVQSDTSYYQTFMQSTDGGISWEKKSAISQYGDYKIYTLNDHVEFLYGSYPGGGILLRSADQGHYWKIQNLSCSFNRVFFLDKNTGFAIGGQLSSLALHENGWGYVFKTNDGCKTWEFSYEPGIMPTSLFFVNRDVGFIIIPNAGRGWRTGLSSVYKTNDGGNNWSLCTFDSLQYDFWADYVWFLNEQKGWIIGSNSGGAAISETSNGGETWQTVWQNPDTSAQGGALNSICFVNDDFGWAVGYNGCIVKYTKENGWENRPAVTDLPLNRVFFTNEYNGWVAGGYMNDEDFRTIFVKTEDGGETWEKITLIFLVHDIYFQDNQHGWVIASNRGFNGVILETTDGGDHWAIADNRFDGLKSFHHRDNYLWAVGGRLILRNTMNGTAVADEQKNPSYPQNYLLCQNYPNPFNPKTTIRYAIPEQTHVILKLYDINGREVAALVNQQQSAGDYEINFDASTLPSGVYLCRMKTADFSQTRKCVLVR